MSSSNTAQYLKTKIDFYKCLYKNQRNKNKWLSFGIKIASAVAAALISVFLGLSKSFKDADLAKNISLWLGALITILNVWDSFFNHRALYVKATTSMVNCILLADELDYLMNKPEEAITEIKLNEIHIALKKIVMDNNSHWIELKKQDRTKITR